MSNQTYYDVLTCGLKDHITDVELKNIFYLIKKAEEKSVSIETNDSKNINKIVSVSVTLFDFKDESNDITVLYQTRKPTETSGERRPTACGGEECYVIFGRRICIKWECKRNVSSSE